MLITRTRPFFFAFLKDPAGGSWLSVPTDEKIDVGYGDALKRPAPGGSGSATLISIDYHVYNCQNSLRRKYFYLKCKLYLYQFDPVLCNVTFLQVFQRITENANAAMLHFQGRMHNEKINYKCCIILQTTTNVDCVSNYHDCTEC